MKSGSRLSVFRYMVVQPEHRNFHPWYYRTWQYGTESHLACWKASLQGHHSSHCWVTKNTLEHHHRRALHDIIFISIKHLSFLRWINLFIKVYFFARWALLIVFVLPLTYKRSIWVPETSLIRHMRPCPLVPPPPISNHVLHTDQPEPADY